MQYYELLKAVKDARSAEDEFAVFDAKDRLTAFCKDLHATFWSDVHKQSWLEVMKVDPKVPPLRSRIGTAVFPVVQNGGGNHALYRFVLTYRGNSDSHYIQPNKFGAEAEQNLLSILSTVDVRPVNVEVTLEPEFEHLSDILKDVPIQGNSMQLAFLMALQTLQLQQPYHGDNDDKYVFTGALNGDELADIGSLDIKSKLVDTWRPGSTVISPVQSLDDCCQNIIQCATVLDVKNTLVDPSQSWKKVLNYYQTALKDHEIITQSRQIQDKLQELPVDTLEDLFDTDYKLRLLLKIIEAYNHEGRAVEAIHFVKRLTDFLHDPDSQKAMQDLLTEQEDWQKLLAVLAVSFLDDLQLEAGLQLFDFQLEFSFNPQYRIHYQGSKASLLMAMGRLEEARELYEKNIKLCSTNLRACGELTRTYCYYGNVLRLLKDFDAAEAAFEKGLEYAQKEVFNNANSEPWIHWQYAKLKRDQGRPDAEVDAQLKQADLWMQQNMLLSYPKSQADIENGKKALSKTHTECRLYQSAILRAKAQLHLHKGEEIPEDLLAKLRGLHPTWAELDYAEIWTRIPY